MFTILTKDFRQFFSGLAGLLSIGLFLLLMGLFLFIFPETAIFNYGYATLDKFFELAPWILLMLIPAITMRSFSDEFRTGTWELLRTRPLTLRQIIGGKYLAALLLALLALSPSLCYLLTIKSLSINGSIDTGSIAGAYLGLLLLAACFTAIGIFCSALTPNPIISFLAAAFCSFLLYQAFQSVGSIAALSGAPEYWIQQAGIAAHYMELSRGIVALEDIVYFAAVVLLFLAATHQQLVKK